MSGSLNQAKRRSNGAEDESVIDVGGNMIELALRDPTQEDLLAELARKRTCGTIPTKTKTIIEPLVNNRDHLIAKTNGLSNGLAMSSKIASAIPISLPSKAYTGPQLAEVLLSCHVAIRQRRLELEGQTKKRFSTEAIVVPATSVQLRDQLPS